jgi:ribosomal protein S18 acetylase RimI-like enzyme
LLPETQGKGIGRTIIDEIEKLAHQNSSKLLSLNVNRFNEALSFYQKIGFEIVAEENIAIGNGYLMEDYRMEKKI